MKLRILLLCIFCLILFNACGPKIYEYNVWPNRVCAGDTIHISYNVRGNPRIDISHIGNNISDTITYKLVVEKNNDIAYARKDVIRFLIAPSSQLVFVSQPLGIDSIMSFDSLSGENWKSDLLISTIINEMNRSVNVSHNGYNVVVAARDSVSVTGDLKISGKWLLKSGLLPGEIMGNSQHSPPAG